MILNSQWITFCYENQTEQDSLATWIVTEYFLKSKTPKETHFDQQKERQKERNKKQSYFLSEIAFFEKH